MQKLQQVLVQHDQEKLAGKQNGPSYVYTDKNGKEWQMILSPQIMLCNVFDKMTFQDWPLYFVSLQVSCPDLDTSYEYFMFWPTYTMSPEYINDDYFTPNGSGTPADYDKAVAQLGKEKAESPMTIADAIQAYNATFGSDMWSILADSSNGGYSIGFYVCASPALMEALQRNSVVNGKDCYIKGDGEQGVQLISFDQDTNDIEATLTGLTTTNQSVFLEYVGDASHVGFGPQTRKLDFSEVHVFDAGVIDIDSKWGEIYADEFEPVHMYYFAAALPGMVYDYPGEVGTPAQTQDGRTAYGKQQLPFEGPFFASKDKLGYYSGTIYAPANVDKYDGLYSIGADWDWDFETDAKGNYIGINNLPEEYSFIPGGYTFTPSMQGVRGMVVYPYYSFPVVGFEQQIGLGFTQGFWGKIEDHNEVSVSWEYKGDIVFHNNPSNFLDYKVVDAVGELTTGVENVLDNNAEVVSAEYFNLQGMRLNEAPVKGMYIVRNTLSNGKVVSEKVVK